MDLQKAKITLDKINTLFKSMNIDAGDIAAIERDLMLSYVRQFYEMLLEDGAAPAPTKSKKKSKKAAAKAEAPQRPKLEIVEPPASKPKPQKKAYKPPRIIEIPEINTPEPVTQTPPPPPKPKADPAPVKPPAPTVVPPPPPPPAKPTISAPPGFEGLFEHQAAKELSEKLSARPIADLTKALAINDRLLYMNELFGKNMDALNQALSQLNRFSSIDRAKSFLADLANKYHWLKEDREEIAKDFIKIVRRRYI
ncbi:MAG: hypothetical protein AAF798_09565 [Bacteroidota bacterium]